VKSQSIDLSLLSRYRGELMGIAMLSIVLFHVWLPQSSPFFGLKRMGNVGVDAFFLLSGIGLWYSWTRNRSLRRFYSRRLWRIYPAWIVVACLFYVPDFLGPQRFSSSLIDLIGDVTINWDFWRHDELTFWYVPAILMMYVFAPLYMRLVERHPVMRWLPVVAICWCVAVQWVDPIHRSVGHIEIFWSRVPIFFIGINLGKWVKEGRKLEPASLVLLLILFALTFSTCLYMEQTRHGKFPLFIERMVYIPMTVSSCVLLAWTMSHALPDWLGRFLRLVGSVSLEFYLLHVQFVMRQIEPHRLGYWPTALLTIVITLPLAWLLHRLLEIIIHKIQSP